MAICKRHSIKVYATLSANLGDIRDGLIEMNEDMRDVTEVAKRYERPRVGPPELVYYLRVRPTVVKIGFTQDLKTRLSQLRSGWQYLLAVEHGGRDLELKRHRQFARERFGRREDFLLTPGLREHMDVVNELDASAGIIRLTRENGRNTIPA